MARAGPAIAITASDPAFQALSMPLVARGYAVLLPDPGLSTGYGHDFVGRGHGGWGARPYADLMAITDATAARPDIDQTRTAAMGGSYGGYMANWIAGHTDRFQAIVSHAGLWALDQMFGTTDLPSYWRRLFGDPLAVLAFLATHLLGEPWQRPDLL